MPRGLTSSRNLLLLSVLALLVLSLMPTRYSGWVRGLRNPVDVVIRPASGPFAALSVWLRPEGRSPEPTESEEAIARDRDELKWLYARAVDRIAELESLVKDLQGGAFAAPPGLKRLEGTRVGSDAASGTVDVARGAADGVRKGAVAVARRSEQLVGVATDVRTNVTAFRLLTHKPLGGRARTTDEFVFVVGCVMPEGPFTAAQLPSFPRCQLLAVGDGSLVDENVKEDAAALMQPGMLVRCVDDTWPDAARMLVLGRVVRVEPGSNPLFRRIVVRPDTDISRVKSVIIRWAEQSARRSGPAGNGGAP